jgi:uncharacterized protein
MFIWFMALLYTFANVYISWRIYILVIRTAPILHSKGRAVAFSLLYFLVATTPISGSLLPRSILQISLLKFGDWWLCVMIYVGLLLLIFEAAYFTIKKLRPSWIHRKRLHFTAIIIIAGVSTLFSVAGGIQAEKMVTTNYHINIANQTQTDSSNDLKTSHSIRIAFVADLHLGRNVGIEEMRRMAGRINALKPDLVLIGGDIFDNNYQSIENPKEIIAILRDIRSKYGVFAVYGNHDVHEILIAGFAASPTKLAFRSKQMEQFVSEAGIEILDDQVISIADDSIYLAGRKDSLQAGDGTNNHLTVEQLLSGVEKAKPLIVLEHEPNELQELSEAGADLILGGHTHAGQMFPVTLAMPIIWENPYGMMHKYGSTSIVTSGVGLYGPPIRLLTKSEVVEIIFDY